MDYIAQLKRQIGFLKTSCQTYDSGNFEEGIRLGTTLRVLFHQTGKSTSLMTHLGVSSLKLLSTSREVEKGVRFPLNITNVYFPCAGNGVMYFAPLLDKAPHKRFIDFNDWWQIEPVYRVGSEIVSRKDTVLFASNKDGGTHVDSSIDAKYQAVLEGFNMFKVEQHVDDETGEVLFERPIEVKNAHFAALRQIAYEVLNSPDVLTLVK